jgi:hypothetical protein
MGMFYRSLFVLFLLAIVLSAVAHFFPDARTVHSIYKLLFKAEFEDTKGVIRIRILKKNRQHNGQKKKDKQRSIKHHRSYIIAARDALLCP